MHYEFNDIILVEADMNPIIQAEKLKIIRWNNGCQDNLSITSFHMHKNMYAWLFDSW